MRNEWKPACPLSGSRAAYAEVIQSAEYEYPFRCRRGTGFSFLEKPQLMFGDKTILQPGMVLAVDDSVSVKKLSWRNWEIDLSSRETAMSR